MADRIRAEERLMNLTVALLGTEVGLTRAQIFESVTGYVERAREGVDEPALERMFERDKQQLAELGTRIEVIGDSDNPLNLREARYRIPRDDNALPEDLEFTPAELAVLSLAADAWSEATMSREARAGLRKIRALGLDVDEPIIGFTPRLSAREESFEPLQRAIDRGSEVRFDYLRPGSQRIRNRRVRPLALVQFEGRWHLHAHDDGTGKPRTFLLSRIVSEVQRTGTRFDPADSAGAADRALEGLRALADRQRAVIEVTPGSEAWLRLSRRAVPSGEQGLVVPYVDASVLADELASYGPDARVVAPDDVRDLVLDRLRAVRVLHARPADVGRAEAAAPEKPKRRAALDSTERMRVYLTLVPWLLERGQVPVVEAAREFEVRPEQLRAMLRTLTVVGGPSGGYYTGDMFDIDWDLLDQQDAILLTQTVGIDRVQRFTTREAAALVAGLQLAQAVTGILDDEALDALRRKLARGAGGAGSETLAVDAPIDAARAELSRAVREKKAVRFTYRSLKGDATTRTVDPAGLLLSSSEWYLQGWCHLREATRTFHLERMSDVVVTAETAEHADAVRPELFVPGDADIVATLRFPTRMRPMLAQYLEHAEVADAGAETFARVPIADIGTLRRIAARGGGEIEVVAPASARDSAREWAVLAESLYVSAVD